MLRADDPFLLGSSRGAINASMAVLAEWCCDYKQEFHVGETKTVAMHCARNALAPPAASCAASASAAIALINWAGTRTSFT